MLSTDLPVRIQNSFIPVHGVGEKTERDLWTRGVHHWDAFDDRILGGVRGERVATFIDTARDHLDANDAEFFAETFPNRSTWRLYENFKRGACFLDIETTGLSVAHDDVTVVGMHFPDEGRTRTLVHGIDLTRQALVEELAGADLLVTFNGKTFDVPALERSFDLNIRLPHLDLRYPSKRLGLTGGLKEIEYVLGIDRETSGLTGRDAVRLWREYRRGSETALETLLQYNRDDVTNLPAVAEPVVAGLHQRVFESVIGH